MRFFNYSILLIFIFSLGNITNIYSQSIFSDGYIITNNGDSIKGQLKLMPISQLYKKCYFLFENGSMVSYKSDAIREFGIYDYAQFRSLKGKNEFYEVLIDGKMALYNNNQLFIIGKDTLLLNISPNKSPSLSISEKYNHLSLLKTKVADCQQAYSIINMKTRGKRDYVEIVNEYNKCFPEELIPVMTKKKKLDTSTCWASTLTRKLKAAY